ncbi:MAG: hypothetical protein OEU92_17085 [Alphaproteobacteria bacterium]|nr:hypothetical protein [Alphaproteobacteria bacterium]
MAADLSGLDQAIDKEGRLRIHLVPMPSGDNPWRTKGDDLADQRREHWRFRLTIASLVVSMIATVATALIAIDAIRAAL